MRVFSRSTAADVYVVPPDESPDDEAEGETHPFRCFVRDRFVPLSDSDSEVGEGDVFPATLLGRSASRVGVSYSLRARVVVPGDLLVTCVLTFVDV